MANIKSQIKRIRTNEAARMRNKSVKSSVKTAIRKFREAADAGDKDKATALLRDASRAAGQGRQQGRHPRQPGRQQEVRDGGSGQPARAGLTRAFSSASFLPMAPIRSCGSAPSAYSAVCQRRPVAATMRSTARSSA